MAKCKECVYQPMCYKIEHFGRDLETDEACEHLREAAKMIEYPVKIGDTVYEIRQKGNAYKGRKYDNSVTTQKRMKHPPICGATLYVKEKPFVKSDFCRLGGTVFLTRTEAENALKERDPLGH